MVDALRNIHQSLVPEGLLLDIHPEPEHARVEIWQRDRIHAIGRLDESQDIEEILHAEAQLATLVAEGWFIRERFERFEMLIHFPTLEDWMERRASKSSTSIIPDQVLASARRLLSEGEAELVLRQRNQIALFRRSQPGG